MKRRTGGWALAIAFVVAGCARPAPAPPQTAPLAELTALRGEVTLKRGVNPPRRPLTEALYKDDLLATGPDSSVQLKLRDGRELTLRENSSLRLGEDIAAAAPQAAAKPGATTAAITLDLSQGSIVARTPASAAAGDLSLTISTPFGITRIPAGESNGTISVGAQKVAIDVSLGSITFAPKNGQPVVAGAGDKIEGDFGRIELLHATAPAAAPAAPAKNGVMQVAPIEFVLAAASGSVQVRRRGDKRFTALKNESTLAEGTAFRVLSGGRGHLETRGFSAWLSGGAQGTIGKATQEGEKERYELSLERGTSLITLGAGKPKEVQISGPNGAVVLHATEQTSVSVTQGSTGPVVDVISGRAEVQSGESHERMTAGSTARLHGGKLVVGVQGRTGLILPTVKGLRVYGDELEEVGLSWPPEIKQAAVEVAGDPGFARMVVAGRVSGSRVFVTPPAHGPLFWRVSDTASGRKLEGQARFASEEKATAAAQSGPRTVVAETGLKATVHFQSGLPALTLTFAEQKGAVRYRVRVYAAADPKTPVLDQPAAAPSCQLPPAVLTEGSYTWTVTGLDVGGAEISVGPTSKLELVFDNALTSLIIDRPSPGEKATTEGVLVRGAVPLGAKLSVNDRPMSLDGKGRFDARIDAAESVVFHMTESTGAETFWVRKVGSSAGLARGRDKPSARALP